MAHISLVRQHHILPCEPIISPRTWKKLTKITGSSAAVSWYPYGHTVHSRTKPSPTRYCHCNVISVQIVRHIEEMYYLWQKFISQRLSNNFIMTLDPGIRLMILRFKKEFYSNRRHAVDKKNCFRIFNC